MYRSCITCNRPLGENREIEAFPVGSCLAFDAARGRLWAVCPHCRRWNLSPLEERWEAIEACERRFRASPLRVSTDNIGLAQLPSGLALIRVGPALRPEIAAWRYGRRLLRRRAAGARALAALAGAAPAVLQPAYDALAWARLRARGNRVVAVVDAGARGGALVRWRHLERAELLRPDRFQPWRMRIEHEVGPLVLAGETGLRTAGKLLASLNGALATQEVVQRAVRRLEDAGNEEGYFGRVAALTLRTSWGRFPDTRRDAPFMRGETSQTERLALFLTNRSFWARGALGSEPRLLLPRLPIEDRLALEMAANEDAERRALQGELRELEEAWREAEEIAGIADGLLDERAALPRGLASAAPAGA